VAGLGGQVRTLLLRDQPEEDEVVSPSPTGNEDTSIALGIVAASGIRKMPPLGLA
jgi:hypothetical protein